MSCKEDKADYVVLHLTDYGKVTYDVSIDVQGYVSPTFQKNILLFRAKFCCSLVNDNRTVPLYKSR